jgi:hypothetical protein
LARCRPWRRGNGEVGERREKRGFSGGGAREEKARVRVYRREAAGDQKIRRGK